MPERDEPDNEVFNNHLSMIRIRSEHAIGFLKGRFQSLKGLRLRVVDSRSHKFATYWVLACTAIHAFAMQCEAEERASQGEDADTVDDDPFIRQGLSDSDSSDDGVVPQAGTQGGGSAARVRAGRAQREYLKRRLLRAKERHAEHWRRAQF